MLYASILVSLINRIILGKVKKVIGTVSDTVVQLLLTLLVTRIIDLAWSILASCTPSFFLDSFKLLFNR